MSSMILTNAKIVSVDSVFEGSLIVQDGRIVDVDDAPCRAPGAVDLDGDYLLPGFVELHTDNLEKHFAPRPGVSWPSLPALMAHDTQIAAGGITTVFDSLALGDVRGATDRVRNKERMMEAITAVSDRRVTRAEHRVHLRCEIVADDAVDSLDRWIDSPLVGLVSVNDHTPGQRQFTDPAKLRLYYTKKYGMSDVEFDAFEAQTRALHAKNAARHRAEIVSRARARALPIASHDDATVEHVVEAVRNGMSIAEFPTTLEAAEASHEAGMSVLVGAPNLVLGGSHSGNVAAIDLVRAGRAHILSSDYVPASLLEGVFALPQADTGLGLADAVRLATFNPARAVGLHDRGEIAPGRRADLVRVRVIDDAPTARAVWREGERVV